MKKSTAVKTCAGIGGVLLVAAGLVFTGVVASPFNLTQRGPPQQDMLVDQTMRTEVIDGLIGNLNQYYVFPEKAKQLETLVRGRQQRGDYDGIASAEAFAATLTDDLQGLTKDLHLRVGYSEQPIPESDANAPAQIPAEELAELKRLNFGVHAVDRLEFNIGYIDLRGFAPPELVASRLAAAMTLLGDTRALIIDLRSNYGGEPATVALLASYLFDERTHLNDIYHRDGDRTEEFWTSDQLAGPRYGSAKKVYVLTSNDTFSAGEDLAYALKNLKRATLIGAATGGGANPGELRRLNAHFAVFVSSGRAVSPVTRTNWEGVGVTPDIAMDPDKALNHAQILILKNCWRPRKTKFGGTPSRKVWRSWIDAIDRLGPVGRDLRRAYLRHPGIFPARVGAT